MKIIVVGASGTIGSALVQALKPNHEVIEASRHGSVQVDLISPTSIEKMYEQTSSLQNTISKRWKVT
jgi:dTDP-4-dehydrorhamnose reductase